MEEEPTVVPLWLYSERIRLNQIEQWMREGKFESIADTLCNTQPMSTDEELDDETR